MDDTTWLAGRFEAHRAHLRAVAYRMLGSMSDADDAVQESWIRLSRSETSAIDNLGGWLTTVTSRVCLDMLRTRKARREDAVAEPGADRETGGEGVVLPEDQAIVADSVGPAMLIVLDALSPAERIAFVLHDMFVVSFDEIAPIVGRSPEATRQLASRARRRVQGADPVAPADVARQREVVRAFLAAAHNGDFEALLAVLDPDVVFRADPVGLPPDAPREVRGARAVAEQFSGRARGARTAVVDGSAAIVVAPGGKLRMLLGLTFADDRILAIDVTADQARLAGLEVTALDD